MRNELNQDGLLKEFIENLKHYDADRVYKVPWADFISVCGFLSLSLEDISAQKLFVRCTVTENNEVDFSTLIKDEMMKFPKEGYLYGLPIFAPFEVNELHDFAKATERFSSSQKVSYLTTQLRHIFKCFDSGIITLDKMLEDVFILGFKQTKELERSLRKLGPDISFNALLLTLSHSDDQVIDSDVQDNLTDNEIKETILCAVKNLDQGLISIADLKQTIKSTKLPITSRVEKLLLLVDQCGHAPFSGFTSALTAALQERSTQVEGSFSQLSETGNDDDSVTSPGMVSSIFDQVPENNLLSVLLRERENAEGIENIIASWNPTAQSETNIVSSGKRKFPGQRISQIFFG